MNISSTTNERQQNRYENKGTSTKAQTTWRICSAESVPAGQKQLDDRAKTVEALNHKGDNGLSIDGMDDPPHAGSALA